MAITKEPAACVPVDSTQELYILCKSHPLIILDTSGTTG
jgi:acyl-coenzyme A synthetase/AMP-(fatty) acid ligase